MATENAEYVGVSELAAAVGEALSEIVDADKRMKSGATEIPSERTIRFYLEKGLLPKPSKRLGQTLVFGRLHLLTLLVIKKLQADGVPLSAIPDVLKKKGRTEAQLEELLTEDVKIFRSRSSPESFRERTGHADDSDLVVSYPQAAMRPRLPSDEPPAEGDRDIPTNDMSSASRQGVSDEEMARTLAAKEQPQAGAAKSYLKSLLSRSPRTKAAPPRPQSRSQSAPEVLLSTFGAPQPPLRWTRHEPALGLEINISDDYEVPTDEHGKENLLEAIRKILGL